MCIAVKFSPSVFAWRMVLNPQLWKLPFWHSPSLRPKKRRDGSTYDCAKEARYACR